MLSIVDDEMKPQRNELITNLKSLLHPLKILGLLVLVYGKAEAQWTTDTISFEIPATSIVIDTVGGNVWQIGKPQKIFFDSSHSGSKAMLTDTLNAYPPNDTSSFIYVIRNPYTQTCLTCMEFWHKYDMGSTGDQGLIDASYDGGNSWVLVKDSFYVLPIGSSFMWNSDYHASTGSFTSHPLITTGTSDGWIQSSFCWQWYLPVNPDTIISNPDSLLIRFTFMADSIADNSEGWMIDDIVTSSAGLEMCSGTKESYDKERVTVSPNPFSTQAILQTEKTFKNATLNICNSLGQPIRQVKNISGQLIILNRDNLPGGLYFLQLTQDKKILKTVKVIITDD